MHTQHHNRSLVLAALIAIGLIVPSPSGEGRERQPDLVKALSINPVEVVPLSGQG